MNNEVVRISKMTDEDVHDAAEQSVTMEEGQEENR
jgi:hypothetical protein